jgi:hypothetical protein
MAAWIFATLLALLSLALLVYVVALVVDPTVLYRWRLISGPFWGWSEGSPALAQSRI